MIHGSEIPNAGTEKPLVSTEENKALVVRYIEEVLNQGRLDAVDLLCARDLLIRVPHLPGVLRGREVLKQLVNYNRIIFPDGHVDIEDIIAEGDKVSSRGTFRGTYHGNPFERKISDKVMPIVLISGIAIY